MTFGERIKEYRKNMGFTQSTLAERLGISEQSVSKWETGITMPDVSTLVPLASVLGVSVDSLLGVATNADEEINAAYKEVNERWKDGYNDQSKDHRQCDRALDYYRVTSKLVKKYPNNMDLALNCVYWAESVLGAYKEEYFESDEKEEKALFREIEILTDRIWKFDDRLSNKEDAKYQLIAACCYMGYYGRAEAECECFGGGLKTATAMRIIAECSPAVELKDFEKRLEAQRNEASYKLKDYFLSHLNTVRALGSLGDVRIKDTIKEYENFITILDAFKGVYSEDHRLWMKMTAMKMLGGSYCLVQEYEKALEIAEKIGDAAEEYFRLYKEGVPECLMDFDNFWWKCIYEDEATDESIKEELYWRTTFWDNFDDTENNPIVNSPRYKAVVERIRNLK